MAKFRESVSCIKWAIQAFWRLNRPSIVNNSLIGGQCCVINATARPEGTHVAVNRSESSCAAKFILYVQSRGMGIPIFSIHG